MSSGVGPVFGQDPEEAAWLGPRLTGRWGHVTGVVPAGYEAYARVLHPIETEEGKMTTWAAVAEAAGTRMHAQAQWNRIGAHRPGRRDWWCEVEPEEGNLPSATLALLVELLGQHTATAGDCWFGLWDGYGWIHGSPSVGLFTFDDETGRSDQLDVPPAFPPNQLAPEQLVHLPGRNYLLGRGPLDAALHLGHQITPNWFTPQSPNLLWPTDRTWFLSTEIDFDSTLIAGTHHLINTLVDHPHLEGWRVQPGDSLQHNADHIN